MGSLVAVSWMLIVRGLAQHADDQHMVNACRAHMSEGAYPYCAVSGASNTAGGLIKPVHFYCGPAGYTRDSIQKYLHTHSQTDLRCTDDHFHLEQQSAQGPVIVSFRCASPKDTYCKMKTDLKTQERNDQGCC